MELVGQTLQVLPAVKELGGGAGTTSAGLSFAGRNTTVNLATTEEWTGAGPVTRTITAS
jgi:hypothetical protein